MRVVLSGVPFGGVSFTSLDGVVVCCGCGDMIVSYRTVGAFSDELGQKLKHFMKYLFSKKMILQFFSAFHSAALKWPARGPGTDFLEYRNLNTSNDTTKIG